MKQSLVYFVRALAVVLLFVPGPIGVINTPEAVAAPVEIVAAEPAVEVAEASEEATEDPWTARFLAPTVVVISVIALGGSLAYYVVRIRGRYRVT